MAKKKPPQQEKKTKENVWEFSVSFFRYFFPWKKSGNNPIKRKNSRKLQHRLFDGRKKKKIEKGYVRLVRKTFFF